MDTGQTNETEKKPDTQLQDFSISIPSIKEQLKVLFDKEKREKNPVYAFAKKHWLWILIAFIVLIEFLPNGGVYPWGGMWMRLQTRELPATYDWAQSSVHNFYRGQVAQQVNQKYPHLPDAQRTKLIEEEFAKLLTDQNIKSRIEQQTSEAQAFLKSHWEYEFNGKKYTYMPDIDPYAFMVNARNLLEKGMLGDAVIDGKEMDTLQRAPIGTEVTQKFLQPYLLAAMYIVMHTVNPTIDLMQASTYFPILFVTLAIVLAFLVGNKLAGPIGGVFASVLLAVNPAALSRTTWGHADTDPYNLFFPLLNVLLFIYLIESQGKKRYWYAALTGISVGLYAFAWSGWWHVFDFILIAIACFLVYPFVTHYHEPRKAISHAKEMAIALLILIAVTGIVTTLLTSKDTYMEAFKGPLGFLKIKQAAYPSLWPNVYTTVAELNPAPLQSVISMIGGKLLLLLTLVGIVLTTFNKDEHGRREVRYAILLAIWVLSTLYASTKGVRFTLLVVPAMSIAIGVAVGIGFKKIVTWASANLKLNKALTGVVLLAIIAFIPVDQVKASYGTAKGDFPLVNDAWWSVLTSIRDSSQKNAIINSWWDFGHHFKYIAERPVTFDGGQQSSPPAHWVGRALATADEKEAIGLLRMLDCGWNTAFDELQKQNNEDIVDSIKTIYKIVVVDKEPARKILANKIKDPDKVLKYTHCNPPENYFITSHDMIGKAGVWAHFGNWNFEKAYIWLFLKNKDLNTAVEYMVSNYNYTKEQAEQAYFEAQSIFDEGNANTWISSWPGYLTGPGNCQKNNTELNCDNGIFVDLKELKSTVKIQQGEGTPNSIVYIDEKGKFVSKKLVGPSMGISVVLIPNGKDNYQAMLVSPELAPSMFTRLYFMEGHGLKHFDLFKKENQLTGGHVIAWKVDWEGKTANEHSALT